MERRNLLTLAELSRADLSLILDLSERLKKTRGSKNLKPLVGKTVALLFEKPSTRTRVSFQVAVSELGGNSITMSSSELQLGRGETVEDTARVLSRYVHGIMARVNKHEDVERLAAAASVPVINGLSDLYHPVQILADLLALKEHKGKLEGLKVAWVGDGNNVCNSWIIGAALAGVGFRIAVPKGYEPAPVAMKSAKSISGRSPILSSDPVEAVGDADCVMTDTFVSMGFDSETKERKKAFYPRYQVNERLMALAKDDAVFEHCLPAHRGEEVTGEVIDGPQSIVWDEAEDRLHTTKALLCFLLLGGGESRRLAKGAA